VARSVAGASRCLPGDHGSRVASAGPLKLYRWCLYNVGTTYINEEVGEEVKRRPLHLLSPLSISIYASLLKRWRGMKR
jgi:hypothetical protein